MSRGRSLRAWIRDHRAELDEAIRRAGGRGPWNDAERRLWVLNEWMLYSWAKREGVNL